MMATLGNNYSFEDYLQCFYSFLDAHKLKRSSERNAILRTVYDYNKHFTFEHLQKKLKQKKYHISQSTLYVTLNLLEKAGLVFKHHFPYSSIPQYEKIQCDNSHNHVYVEGAKEMIEFSDNRINEIIKEVEEKYNVNVVKHSFILYCKK